MNPMNKKNLSVDCCKSKLLSWHSLILNCRSSCAQSFVYNTKRSIKKLIINGWFDCGWMLIKLIPFFIHLHIYYYIFCHVGRKFCIIINMLHVRYIWLYWSSECSNFIKYFYFVILNFKFLGYYRNDCAILKRCIMIL